MSKLIKVDDETYAKIREVSAPGTMVGYLREKMSGVPAVSQVSQIRDEMLEMRKTFAQGFIEMNDAFVGLDKDLTSVEALLEKLRHAVNNNAILHNELAGRVQDLYWIVNQIFRTEIDEAARSLGHVTKEEFEDAMKRLREEGVSETGVNRLRDMMIRRMREGANVDLKGFEELIKQMERVEANDGK